MIDNDFLASYKQVPIITRTMLTLTVAASLAVTLDWVPLSMVNLNWSAILYRFHVHRLLTPFFITRFGFNMLFDLYFMFTYGSQLETGTYAGRPADYAWFVIFTCLVSSVGAYLLQVGFLFQATLMAVIYLWSQANQDRIVSFMFGVTFKAAYFPWVLVAYNYVMMGASVPWSMLLGAGSAHVYYFLDSVYPAMGGPKLIPTPSLLYRLLPPEEVSGGEFTAGGGTANTFRPGSGAGATQTGHRWGGGCRLG